MKHVVQVQIEVTRRGAEIVLEQLRECQPILTRKAGEVPIAENNVTVNEPARAQVVLRPVIQALEKALEVEEEEPDVELEQSIREERYGRSN